MIKRLIILKFLLFSCVLSIKGQEVNITSSFDTSRIFIGDQIQYTIKVDKPSGLRLSIPFFKDTLCKNLEILSGPVVDSSSQNGRTSIIEKYIVTSFDSGKYQLPPVFAESQGKDGLKRFFSDYSLLEVIRVNIAPADTTSKIYDIIKPYRAPVTVDEIMPWVLIIALIAVAVWLIIRYIRKHRKYKTGEEPVANPDPAHVIAFRELEELKAEELWQKGDVRNYYTRLTEILRQYLENRFGVFSLELTTAETLESLLRTGFRKDESYNQLKTVLTVADLVKFAKYNPESSEHELLYQNSWNFVDTTKMIEVKDVAVDEKDKVKEGTL